MDRHDANIDYCGIVMLLRRMIHSNLCTEAEAKRIAARIAVQYGANIIISI